MKNVYITGFGSFLPNDPVLNDDIEKYIGKINDKSTRLGRATLRRNGIESRFYALSTEGNQSFTNAELASYAIKNAASDAKISLDEIELIATSTTIGDQFVPGFASNVHASLNIENVELASFQSVCASSIMAMKTAYLNIKAGEKSIVAVSGSEFASRWFKPDFYKPLYENNISNDSAMSIEFLRWTLSDGAGSVILEENPKPKGINLKVEWIELKSFADKFDPCMYAGIVENRGKDKTYWGEFSSPLEAYQNGAMVLRQDFELLYEMFPIWLGYYLEILEKYDLSPNEIDHYLPHYSAESLADEMKKLLIKVDALIPETRWFNNLKRCGNTGTASIFIMLDEFVRTKELNVGEKILCFVPESGQCMASFMLLTVETI